MEKLKVLYASIYRNGEWESTETFAAEPDPLDPPGNIVYVHRDESVPDYGETLDQFIVREMSELHVPRCVPGFHLYSEPAKIVVSPSIAHYDGVHDFANEQDPQAHAYRNQYVHVEEEKGEEKVMKHYHVPTNVGEIVKLLPDDLPVVVSVSEAPLDGVIVNSYIGHIRGGDFINDDDEKEKQLIEPERDELYSREVLRLGYIPLVGKDEKGNPATAFAIMIGDDL